MNITIKTKTAQRNGRKMTVSVEFEGIVQSLDYIKDVGTDACIHFSAALYVAEGLGYKIDCVASDSKKIDSEADAYTHTLKLIFKEQPKKQNCTSIAKRLGLTRGKGTYNGGAYWKRHGSNAIISRADLEQIANDAGLI